MEIVELMARNQYERCLPDDDNDKRPLEGTLNAANAHMYSKGKSSILHEKTVHKPKHRVKGGRYDKIIRDDNTGAFKPMSGAFISPPDRHHVNFSQLGTAYSNAGFRFNPEGQEKVHSGVRFSATSSSAYGISQNYQWVGNMMGQTSSQTNMRISESCGNCMNVPQGKETGPSWSSMVQNHMHFSSNNQQKHLCPPANADMFSNYSSSFHKANMNGNRDTDLLNLNVGNSENHRRSIDSQFFGKTVENPATCKHTGRGSLDLYSNETISAMHLLSLMDPKLSSTQSMDVNATPKFQKRPSFPHDHHAKDFPYLSSGGYKTSSAIKPPAYGYFSKNFLSENSRDRFPSIPNVNASGFAFPFSKNVKEPTDLLSQPSLKFQGGDRAKAVASTSQSKSIRSNKSDFAVGGSSANLGSFPTHSIPNVFFGTSDPMVSPSQPHVKESAPKRKSETRNNASTSRAPGSSSVVLPSQPHVKESAPKQKSETCNNASTSCAPESSSRTEICSINRNPADFSVPEAGNVFMIRGVDLKFPDPPPEVRAEDPPPAIRAEEPPPPPAVRAEEPHPPPAATSASPPPASRSSEAQRRKRQKGKG